MEKNDMGLSPLPIRTWVRGSCIGVGSFGTVSLALNKSNGHIFAVKSVDSNPSSSSSSSALSSINSLENEIQILRSLSSPYIVSYLGDDFTRESPTEAYRNLHMEYMAGGTVAELAARDCAKEESEVRSYGQCVARALQYLHSFGIVHGDVKGRNVLVGPTRGQAKLADFGSARRISGGGGGADVEGETKLPRGTPLWMAPEVVRGEGQTPASDVWSLGCTVIEIVTGKPPWQDRGAEGARRMLLRIAFGDEAPEFPPQLSKSGRDFLDKCLRRNASERWTCEQLLRHPFLAESTGTDQQSPRSVLDWINLDFESEEDEEKDSNRDSSSDSTNSNIEQVLFVARERVRELASQKEVVWENSEGWEVVRSVRESLLPCLGESWVVQRGRGREGEGTCPEFRDFEGGEWEDRDGDRVGETSGGELACIIRWPSSCSSTSCWFSRCCKVGLGCPHRASRSGSWSLKHGGFFGWCERLLHMVMVNAHIHTLLLWSRFWSKAIKSIFLLFFIMYFFINQI